jgi:hypothetical protein
MVQNCAARIHRFDVVLPSRTYSPAAMAQLWHLKGDMASAVEKL